MKNLFARRATPGRAAMVKAWVTERLELGGADLVTVAELTCHEPGCPPVETVVTVHASDGQRHAWRINRPLAEIGQTDIAAALAAEDDH